MELGITTPLASVRRVSFEPPPRASSRGGKLRRRVLGKVVTCSLLLRAPGG